MGMQEKTGQKGKEVISCHHKSGLILRSIRT